MTWTVIGLCSFGIALCFVLIEESINGKRRARDYARNLWFNAKKYVLTFLILPAGFATFIFLWSAAEGKVDPLQPYQVSKEAIEKVIGEVYSDEVF